MIKRITIIILLLTPVILTADTFKNFYSNKQFTFFRQDNVDYNDYINVFTESYTDIKNKFDIKSDFKIKVYIFASQRNFIEKVYGYYDNQARFHGMAKRGENTIYITSYKDSTYGLNHIDFLKIAKHELVHTLLEDYYDRTWLSEGIAIYYAQQEFKNITLPKNIEEMNEYLSYNYTFIEAYEYYAWFTKYLISKKGLKAYLDFYRSNNNWDVLGYSSQIDFCNEAYEEYLKDKKKR